MDDLALVESYQNEMEARFWASVLLDQDIRSVIKPLGMGYGGMGQSSFVPHGVFVLREYIENARRIIQTSDTPTDDRHQT